jgi:hypothetical protein
MIPVALNFSNFQQVMAEDVGFESFDKSQFPNHQYNWAQKIDKDLINELLFLLYLVHDNPKSQAFADWLQNFDL